MSLPSSVSRRDCLTAAGGLLAAGALSAQPRPKVAPSFGYCLNMGFLRAFRLPLDQEIAVAAEAGYGAIEPWIDNVRRYLDAGHTADELRRLLADKGLAVPGAIGFANWLADDDAARAKGLEQAKADLELVKSLGGTALAAPPVGHTDQPIDPHVAATRYRALLDTAEPIGVTPLLEIWGFARSVQSLPEALAIAAEAGHPRAAILPDVYHLYRGGSSFAALGLLANSAFPLLHMNDYPDTPAREQLKDSDRRLPGEGVAPWQQILGGLRDRGWTGWLSIELFPGTAPGETALGRAKQGLAAMRALVAKLT
ncbi:MAG: sugar phosphate isomerase/epimerase [Armatimonadetes bacterium]|nr:sugar phosphate isomerase/epimerase [Armatimonadota bacterium]